MTSITSLLHTQWFSDACRTVEAGSPVSQGPFFKGSLTLVISQGLKVSVPDALVCAWEELWLLKAEFLPDLPSFKCEEQNCQVCLKLEDELRKHKKWKSNLLKLVAFKNGVTVGHVSVGKWSASENNPCFSWRGKTPCLVGRNTLTFSLQNLQEVLCTCLYVCVSNFSQFNRLFSLLISAVTHVPVHN